MAVYLARSCPKVRNYFGVVIAEPQSDGNAQPFASVAPMCGYEVNCEVGLKAR